MQVPPHFERLSLWLRGQHRSVERVESEQCNATHLVSTAEYELGRLRRELRGLALEPDSGIASLSEVDMLATKVAPQQSTLTIEREYEGLNQGEDSLLAAQAKKTRGRDSRKKRAKREKASRAQSHNLSSDAA